MSCKEILNKWDGELSSEAIVSRLLHKEPSEDNLLQGIREIEILIQKQKYVKSRKQFR